MNEKTLFLLLGLALMGYAAYGLWQTGQGAQPETSGGSAPQQPDLGQTVGSLIDSATGMGPDQ